MEKIEADATLAGRLVMVKPSINEAIKESDGLMAHSLDCWLKHWAEHFMDQFSRPMVTVDL